MVSVLKKRSDFLACNGKWRAKCVGFTLIGRDRSDDDKEIRVGFTASKKVGNAVARNRAKRRLRALARDHLVPNATPGWDYVLIARPEITASRDYSLLIDDVRKALSQ